MRKLAEYKTIAFDCDGIILNSNVIKTSAFYAAGIIYGEEKAQKLVKYHKENGGISRFRKFRWFCENIVADADESTLDTLLKIYAKAVYDGLMSCEIVEGLSELRSATLKSGWLTVSGGAQDELRDIFSKRNLANYFDKGVYGSPDTKVEIFKKQIAINNIEFPALFIGDSKYDFISSSKAGLDFVFMTYWTEVKDWCKFCRENCISYRDSLQSLL